ncbi:hypothetical protein CBL_09266 [Carabus blaptoides fortunei]
MHDCTPYLYYQICRDVSCQVQLQSATGIVNLGIISCETGSQRQTGLSRYDQSRTNKQNVSVILGERCALCREKPSVKCPKGPFIFVSVSSARLLSVFGVLRKSRDHGPVIVDYLILLAGPCICWIFSSAMRFKDFILPFYCSPMLKLNIKPKISQLTMQSNRSGVQQNFRSAHKTTVCNKEFHCDRQTPGLTTGLLYSCLECSSIGNSKTNATDYMLQRGRAKLNIFRAISLDSKLDAHFGTSTYLMASTG